MLSIQILLTAILGLSLMPLNRIGTPPEEVYLRLNLAKLFTICDIEVQEAHLAVSSISYRFGDPVYAYGRDRPPVYPDYVNLGVYTSVGSAQQSYRYWTSLSSVSPPPPPAGPPIGEEMQWGYGERGPNPGATIQFRRKNVVVMLSKRGSPSEAVALARQIDTLICNNREIAPLGKFDVLPEIVSTGIPKTLTVQPMKEPLPPPAEGVRRVGNWPEFRNPGGGDTKLAYINIRPRFRGLGDVSKLRLRLVPNNNDGYGNMLQSQLAPEAREYPPGTVPIYVPDGPDRVRVVKRGEAAAQGVDGRFIMQIVVPDEPKILKLTMIAATEDNLIVTKDVEVRIVPQE